jgi:hypothetical protein
MYALWLMTATWAAGAPVDPPPAEYAPAPQPPMVRVISSGGARLVPDYTGRAGTAYPAPPQVSPYHATTVPQAAPLAPASVSPVLAPVSVTAPAAASLSYAMPGVTALPAVTVYSSPAVNTPPYAYAKPGASPPLSGRDRAGHEHDYSWITGYLYYVHADGGRWVLRYAALDQVDRYGGSVVLAPGMEMGNYREGDLVTVHGEVLSEGRATRSLGGALYRVQLIEMVERR